MNNICRIVGILGVCLLSCCIAASIALANPIPVAVIISLFLAGMSCFLGGLAVMAELVKHEIKAAAGGLQE